MLVLGGHFAVGPFVENLEDFEVGQFESGLEVGRVGAMEANQFEDMRFGGQLGAIDFLEDGEDGGDHVGGGIVLLRHAGN